MISERSRLVALRVLTLAVSVSLGAFMFMQAVATGAMIDPVGLDPNQPAWQSTSVAKALDVNSDDLYGTDGFTIFGVTDDGSGSSATFGTNSQGTLPSYISALSAGSDFVSHSWNFPPYASGDDPRLAAGSVVADAQLGGANGPGHAGSGGAVDHLISFTVAAGAPTSFRAGILYGNIAAGFRPTAIRISENGGPGTATISGIVGVGVNDPGSVNWAFFDISGAQVGDVFDVFGTVRNQAGDNDRVSIGGIVFDSPTPEPAAFVLAIFGMLWLACSRFRNRRTN